MKVSRIRLNTMLLTSAAAAALCAPAHAQTAGDSAVPMVGEVVVTATRRQESLQEVPMAVDVVNGQQLSKLNIFDFHDVSQLAPGVQMTNNDGRSNVISMRGITYNPDSGAPPAVDLYINEVPVDAQTALTSIYDVGQIEVLRGPQGVFRGRTSPAGSVTLTYRAPDLSRMTGYLQASGSTKDAENFQGAVSIPLVEDKLAIRLSGLYDHNRGNGIRNVNLGDDYSSGKTQSYRVSVKAAPTDTFTTTLTYQYLHSDVKPYVAAFGTGGEVFPGSDLFSGPPLSIEDRRSVSESSPRFQNRSHLLTLAADQRFDRADLSMNLGYQNTVLDQFTNSSPLNAIPGYSPLQHTKTDYKSFNVDVRLSSVGNGRFSWMVGGNYADLPSTASVTQPNDQFLFLPVTLPPGALPFQCLQGAAATVSICDIPVNVSVFAPPASDSYAAFATLGYRFTDKLRLQGGVRYTATHISQQTFLTVIASGAPAATTTPGCGGLLLNCATLPPALAHRDYHPVTGGASLTYDWTPALTTYVTYGRSYRTGTAAVGVTTPLSSDLLVTPSETSNSFELGLKGEFWDHRISFNGDVFYQKYKNYISHLPPVNASGAANGLVDGAAPINGSGDAISAGAEATVALHLQQFDISAQASYADAHWDNAQIPCNTFDANGNPVIPIGQQVALCTRSDRINQEPKFNFTSTAEYRFEEIYNTTPFIRGLITYRPAFHSDLDNFNYPAFTNLNLYFGVRGPEDRWELTFWSKNLLDQARPLSVSDSIGQQQLISAFGGANPFTTSGYRSAVITPPREFGVTMLVNY